MSFSDLISVVSLLLITVIGALVTWTLFNKSQAIEDAERLTAMQNEVIQRMRAEIVELKQESVSLRAWVSALVDQVVSLGGSPVTLDNINQKFETVARALQSDRARMKRILVEMFSVEEMQSLAFDVELPQDELHSPKESSAERLIILARSRGKLSLLASAILRARPALEE